MAHKFIPFVPVHPGELIKDEIESRGITQKRLSELMGLPYTMLNEMLNGKRPVSTEMALLFEAALDINAALLLNMQSDYSLQVARKNQSLLKRFDNVRRACAAAIL